MATTMRLPQQQHPTAPPPPPPPPAPPLAPTNTQLKHLVYSKYREMLGTYNGKANDIIQALPEYMVHEDKGFNLNDVCVVNNE